MHRLCFIAVISYLVVTTFVDLQWASSLDNHDDSLSSKVLPLWPTPSAKYAFPKNLESAVRSYEQSLEASRTQELTHKVWQTWRERSLSPALEAKWDLYLRTQNPTFQRHVVTDLYDVFPKTFGGGGSGQEYFNRTVARLTPGAARADVWRYATLYHYGGIYIDADSTIAEASFEIWFSNAQRGYEHPVPILSNEGHNWRRQYVSRCQGIWNASNLTLPQSYDRSVLQWMLIFPLPRHPILWQALDLIDHLIAAASYWDDPTVSLADKVLCVTGPVVFTVAVHSVVESFPHVQVHWEGIDYNGKALFKDPATPPDKLHYQSKSFVNGRLIRDSPTL